LQLYENRADIWLVDLDISDQKAQLFIDFLSLDERKRLASIRLAGLQKRFIAGRGYLRYLLSLYLGIRPAAVTLSYTAAGKPLLKGHALEFNLSHSCDTAVYAFSHKNALGVDVEKLPETVNLQLAKRYFSPSEYAQLISLESADLVRAFYRLWTRKEAMIKARGSTLAKHLSKVAVSLEPWALNAATKIDNIDYYLTEIPLQASIQVSLATKAPLVAWDLRTLQV
jgi:4'-phosphopantetheinyl transferase